MNFKEFKTKYEKVPTVQYPNSIQNKPLVSICVQTYQHELYIEKCLDSLINQKTNFDYEILIGEDCSDDLTRRICIDYAKRFPEKVRLFLHSRENNIKINEFHTGRFNVLYNLYSSKGKYIAFCEGDDFWLSPNKLNRQIQIIKEKKAGAVLSDFIYQKKNSSKMSKLSKRLKTFSYYKVDSNVMDPKKYHLSHTSTYLFDRKYLYQLFNHKWLCKSWGLDTLLMPIFFDEGDVYFLREKLTAYRVNHTGISSIKEDGSGSIYKHKAIQFSDLKKFHPNYKKMIVFEQSLAFLKYFSRTMDFSIFRNVLSAINNLQRLKEYLVLKRELLKLLRTAKCKIIAIMNGEI